MHKCLCIECVGCGVTRANGVYDCMCIYMGVDSGGGTIYIYVYMYITVFTLEQQHRQDRSFDLPALSCLKTSCGIAQCPEAREARILGSGVFYTPA